MIKQITLKNYILINDLTVDFDEGLNIITGETGSGKSILINAIDIAFSNRVSKEVIKTGAEKASIELTITSSKKEIQPLFEEFGIDYTGEEILLTKEITQTSVRTRINGTPVNSECIKRLKEMFLDIHSQHHQPDDNSGIENHRRVTQTQKATTADNHHTPLILRNIGCINIRKRRKDTNNSYSHSRRTYKQRNNQRG
jgi:DNA repair ATPase RecN